MTFPDRALAEIDALHRVLQAWFRAEGPQDPALILGHFDPGYTMVLTSGKLITLDGLQAGLPTMWGSRPSLVMTITDETLRHSAPGFALLTYNERQSTADATTNRYSTVLMLDRGEQGPAWRHLHETMIA